MSGLRELQREFQAYVLGESDAVAARIASSPAGSARERLHVYAEGMALRFLEVLGEEYPGVRGLVGDEGFARLGRAYAHAHPSRHPSIRWFGRHLPGWVAATAPWSARPELAEMALFEWAKSELVDEADGPLADVAEVAARAPESWGAMQPRPIAAHRLLALRHDVPAAWRALDAGEAPPPPARFGAPVCWLLWRKGLAIHWRSIDADEAWAITACGEGASFAELCQGLSERVGADDAPLRAATLLRQWLHDEVLASV